MKVTRLVWAFWLVMTLAALGFVWRYGSNVPFWDEWNLVDALTGARPITLEWLWSPHNGHRLPFPRLVLLGLYKVSGGDFRAGMYFNVFLLASSAAEMMWASRRIRGGDVSIGDAVFPLLFLHWGHSENLLWSWQVTQIIPVAVVCGLLAVIAVYGFAPPLATTLLSTVGILVLPLSGLPGLVYAPALVCWLVLVAIKSYREGRRRAAVLIGSAVVVIVGSILFYFYGYRSNTRLMLLADPIAELKTGVKFATGGLGPISWRLWPFSGAATILAMFGASAVLVWRSLHRDGGSPRAVALLLFFVGAACLAASFAFGRTGVGFVTRYFALAVPIWCAAILALNLSVPSQFARIVQISLLLILLLATPLNVSAGLRYAREYHRRMEEFRAELLKGASPEQLVAHHVASLCPCAWSGFANAGLQQEWGNMAWESGFPIAKCVSFHEWIGASLRRLHDANIDGYTHMDTRSPLLREITPSAETGFDLGRAAATEVAGDAAESAVLLTPERPMYVAGVRIRRPAGSAYVPPDEVWGHGDAKGRWVQVFWRLAGQSSYMWPNRYVFLWDPGKEEQIVWIFQWVDEIALHFGDRNVQRQLGATDLPLTVLVPADEKSGCSGPEPPAG